MKFKIAILGSTGSVGDSTLDIIGKDKKNFEVVLLSANNNYKKLIQQAKEFNVKNIFTDKVLLSIFWNSLSSISILVNVALGS